MVQLQQHVYREASAETVKLPHICIAGLVWDINEQPHAVCQNRHTGREMCLMLPCEAVVQAGVVLVGKELQCVLLSGCKAMNSHSLKRALSFPLVFRPKSGMDRTPL